jgi:hypothetical protein
MATRKRKSVSTVSEERPTEQTPTAADILYSIDKISAAEKTRLAKFVIANAGAPLHRELAEAIRIENVLASLPGQDPQVTPVIEAIREFACAELSELWERTRSLKHRILRARKAGYSYQNIALTFLPNKPVRTAVIYVKQVVRREKRKHTKADSVKKGFMPVKSLSTD